MAKSLNLQQRRAKQQNNNTYKYNNVDNGISSDYED